MHQECEWHPAVVGSAVPSVVAEVVQDSFAVVDSHHQRWEEVAVAAEGRSSVSVAGRQRRQTAESDPIVSRDNSKRLHESSKDLSFTPNLNFSGKPSQQTYL